MVEELDCIHFGLRTAERFYENQNMLNLGIDEEYENLTYFEYGMLRLE
jgi:hypothetical protein